MNVYLEKYKALSDREKALLLLSAVVVLYLLFSLLAFSPLDKRQEQLTQDRDQEQQKVSTLSVEMASYAQALTTDPDLAKKAQLRGLENQLQALDQSLVEASVGLVAADQLPKLLQEVLEGMNALQLQEMKTLPVEELLLSGEQVDDGLIDERVNQDAVGVFKHGVEVVFSGKYFDVVAYLKVLEGLKWRFYWDVLDYEVTDYPAAQVRLRVYTLSTEVGAFGSL